MIYISPKPLENWDKINSSHSKFTEKYKKNLYFTYEKHQGDMTVKKWTSTEAIPEMNRINNTRKITEAKRDTDANDNNERSS